MNQEELIRLFMENASKISVESFRVMNKDELNAVLSDAFSGEGLIYCPFVTEKENALAIPEEKQTEDYTKASICIEEVSGAIAETGSIVTMSSTGKPVQAGLLPNHHVAIIPAEKVYEKLDDFFSLFEGSLPTNITIETGPSRTADIELTLTIGVHGPARLTAIIF